MSAFEQAKLLHSAANAPARMNVTYAIQSGRMRGPAETPKYRNPLWSSSYDAKMMYSSASGRDLHENPVDLRSPGHRVSPHKLDAGPAPQPPSSAIFPLRPQRIDLPAYLNTPSRQPDGLPLSREERALTLRRLDDLKLLGFACRRAHKSRVEGRTHFSMAVLQDNLGLLKDAVKSYTAFLRVCKEAGDTQGMSLACHCLGVDYFLLAEQLAAQVGPLDAPLSRPGTGAPGRTGSPSRGRYELDPCQREALVLDATMVKKALWFNNKHRESADSVGRFVAHLNMGLCYRALDEPKNARTSFEFALKYAIQLNSIEGQVLALGALGLGAEIPPHLHPNAPAVQEDSVFSTANNDAQEVRAVVKKYIAASQRLERAADATTNKAVGFEKLGGMALETGEDEEAAEMFEKALHAAKKVGDDEAANRVRVRLGMSRGEISFEDRKRQILSMAQNGIIE